MKQPGDDGLAHAVAGAATNMFRLALRQSATGFMAARHVLRCFGGPAWKDAANVNINPGAVAEAYLTESAPADVRERILARLEAMNGHGDNAREIIAAKLDQLARRNAEIDGFGGPENCEAYKARTEPE